MTVADANSRSIETAEAAFRGEHPRYVDTVGLDELRRTDFARLDRGGQVYLDYTGGGLYASSQLRDHMRLLESDVFGNPHSTNPTSAATTRLVERARACVLDFWGASPDEYVAIFTPNATGALRLVAEAYPFHPGDRFLLTFDNHNSVNGIREFARARGAETTYVPSVAPELRVAPGLLPRYLTETRSTTTCRRFPPSPTSPACSTPSTGSTTLTRTAGMYCSTPRRSSRPTRLTSAAGIPTSSRPRSTRCSAGQPAWAAYSHAATRWPSLSDRGSRVGRSLPPSSSGSTTSPPPARPLRGTLNYLNLPAVELGLRLLDRIGIDTIHSRVSALGAWFLDALGTLEHRRDAATQAADRAIKNQRRLEHRYRAAMSALIDVEDVHEVTAKRELYRRLVRTSDHLANVAERVWYALLKAS
jgi:selenocysteine lyase/cysteine desulfurase